MRNKRTCVYECTYACMYVKNNYVYIEQLVLRPASKLQVLLVLRVSTRGITSTSEQRLQHAAKGIILLNLDQHANAKRSTSSVCNNASQCGSQGRREICCCFIKTRNAGVSAIFVELQ